MSRVRRMLVRGLGAAAFLCLCAGGLRAGEAPPVSREKREALEKRLSELRDRQVDLIIRGESDERLQLTIREALEARRAGDWRRLEEILDAYERPVVEAPEEEDAGAEADTEEEFGVKVRKVSYRSGDLVLSALLFVPNLPDKSPPFPGVLIVHNNFLGTGLAERQLARAIAEKCYTVMIAEPRGYGKNPGRPQFALGEVDDVIAAVKALKALEEVDPKTKPALVGDRHGANCVLLAAARLGDELALTIAVNPYPDLAASLKKPELRSLLRKLRLRISRFDTASTVPRSPYHNVSGIDCPVRIFYGQRNPTVRPAEMARYLALLEAREVKVEEKDYSTAGSDLFLRQNLIRNDLIKALEEIFRPRRPRRGRGRRRH